MDGIRFEIKLPKALAERIDDWRRSQRDIPNRAQAARDLIERGLAPLPSAPPLAAQPEAEAPRPVPVASAETLAQCPWLARDFQDRGEIAMNTRIAERVALQVDFLVNRKKITKKQFIEDALREVCQRELARLGIGA